MSEVNKLLIVAGTAVATRMSCRPASARSSMPPARRSRSTRTIARATCLAPDGASDAQLEQRLTRRKAMDITIIGTGNMARGLASCARWLEDTPSPCSAPRPPRPRRWLRTFPARPAPGTVEPCSPATSSSSPCGSRSSTTSSASTGDQLDGKIVVDITNPIDPATFQRLALDAGSARAGDRRARRRAARVVKVFNTTFAGTLVAGEVAGQPLDVLLASDDEDAKAVISQVVSDGGLRPVDAGPLARAAGARGLGLLAHGRPGAASAP